MTFDLWVTAAEGDRHAESEKLRCRDVDSTAGQVVAEGVRRQKVLDFVAASRVASMSSMGLFASSGGRHEVSTGTCQGFTNR